MPYDKETGEWLSKEQAIERRKARKQLNKAQFVLNKEVGKDLAREPIKTPVGQKQRMQEFREFFLKDEPARKVMQKALDVAMNDEHPAQGTMLKACLDRMLPLSLFEEKKDAGRSQVQINIVGVGEAPVIEGEVIDG